MIEKSKTLYEGLLEDYNRKQAELLIFKKDALRFRYLQNLPVAEAQAFFWNYSSRKRRAAAIDEAIKADPSAIAEKLG
mgnify:CR=1 FL=1